MSTAISLWPNDLTQTSAHTPVHILKEQAQYLANATKGLVIGRVTTIGLADEKFSSALDLIVPAIRSYSYQLLRMDHDLSLYPVTIWAKSNEMTTATLMGQPQKRQVNNEQEFIAVLKEIFESKSTREILSALMAQAKA
ncbi:MAG TPA: hypothetical protein VKX17_25615 [Planctomycetota bacterium]|nr:hypothetical protein [Planctomycetota bacterium]